MRYNLLFVVSVFLFHSANVYSFNRKLDNKSLINENPFPKKTGVQNSTISSLPYKLQMVPCPMADPIVNTNDVCIGSPATINVINPESGILYTLRDNSDNSIVDGPKVSTGSDLSFLTGNLNSATTYNILAESDKHSIMLSGSNAGVLLPSNSLMEVTDNFTIEGWIKPNNTTDYSRLFNKNSSYALGLSGGQNFLTFTRHSLGDFSVAYSFITGEWYHIACTFVSGTVEFFVNGVSIGTAIVPLPIEANSTPAQIGSDTGGGHNHFTGNIDNVRLWNSVRTESEIFDNMHSLLTNDGNPDLIGSWWLIEGAGTPLDYSGNTIHGIGFQGNWSVDAPTTACDLTLSTTPTVNVLLNSITLTSDSGTDAQSVCLDESILDIVYTTTGASSVMVSGLPDGVNYLFEDDLVTISGTPTESSEMPFNYTVTLLGGCGDVTANGSILVQGENTIILSSDPATSDQVVCINTPVSTITYTITGASSVIVSGLPAGVDYTFLSGTLTISGSPAEAAGSPFEYIVTLLGGCGNVGTSGTITVNPDNTIVLSSLPGTTDQTVCINTPIVDITYNTTGATGASFSGLPDGVTGSFLANEITISGSPSNATGSPYNYSVNLSGGCGAASMNGSITVIPDNTLSLSSGAGSDAQTVCINTPITPITYAITGASSVIVSGLPAGVDYAFLSGTLSISGSPSVSAGSPFEYIVTVIGGCGTVGASGTISVNPDNTIALSSLPETTDQTVCINTPIANIIYNTTGATGATFSGLPDGVTGSILSNEITISGTPTESSASPYTFTVTLTGGCGLISSEGTITVVPDNTITLISDPSTLNQSVCTNVAIIPIQYVTTGATGINFVDIPIGVEAIWENDTITISGAPGTTIGSPFLIGIELEGGCGTVGTQFQISTVSSTMVNLTSGSGSNIQTVCLNENINPITYSIEGATGASVSGLPDGVIFTFENNELEISGSPTTLTGSPFNYMVILTGDCSMTNATGAISVSPLPSADPINNIVVCDADFINTILFTSSFPNASFSWENTNTDIGLASSGSDSIPGFIATNTSNAPIEATITIIPESTSSFDCNPLPVIEFSNTTPLSIPTGPAIVSNTIMVSGAPEFIMDINLRTFIVHTFAADLDITVRSPQGTVVTLTTDNGAGNDNVFNGTLWDDSANPGGQVPYTTNSGLVTDHPYVNLVTAEHLVPEEALGAFIGENPNGEWLITISDDLAGDGGSLNSWTIYIQATDNPPVGTNFEYTQTEATFIPTGPAVVSSTLQVTGADNYLLDVNLLTNISHTFAADLDITIMSPSGTVVTLTTDNGAGNDNVFLGTFWDDSANPGGQVPYVTNNGLVTDHAYVNLVTATPLVPEEALAAFIGEDPNGTWTITISDDLAGDGGSLENWTLYLKTTNCGSVCAGESEVFTITVNPVPVVNQIETVTFCNGGATQEISFTSPTIGGELTYSWTNDNPGIGLSTFGTGNIPSFNATNFSNAPINANIKVVPTFTHLGVSCVGDTMSFLITIDPILCGWTANPNGINCIGGSQADYNLSNNTWQITSTNCFHTPGSTQDAAAFVHQILCGDGSITAQVTGLTGNGWAGVMMRENSSAGSKKAALLSSMSTMHRRDFRTVTNGPATSQTFNGLNRNWLRIVRSGQQFSLYMSANGISWQFIGAQNIDMPQCLEIGLTVTNPNSNSTITGSFANVIITGNTNPLNLPIVSNLALSAQQELLLYPNPAYSEVHLELSDYKDLPVDIRILNIHGQVILTKQRDRMDSGTETLSLSNLPGGIYLVNVKSPGLPDRTKRLVVTR